MKSKAEEIRDKFGKETSLKVWSEEYFNDLGFSDKYVEWLENKISQPLPSDESWEKLYKILYDWYFGKSGYEEAYKDKVKSWIRDNYQPKQSKENETDLIIKTCECDIPHFKTPEKSWCSSCMRPVSFGESMMSLKEANQLLKDKHKDVYNYPNSVDDQPKQEYHKAQKPLLIIDPIPKQIITACNNWIPDKGTSGTICSNCGKDRWEHRL